MQPTLRGCSPYVYLQLEGAVNWILQLPGISNLPEVPRCSRAMRCFLAYDTRDDNKVIIVIASSVTGGGPSCRVRRRPLARYLHASRSKWVCFVRQARRTTLVSYELDESMRNRTIFINKIINFTKYLVLRTWYMKKR